MGRILRCCVAVLLAALGGAARAGDPAPVPEAPTFDAVQVRPNELPPGVEIVTGVRCVSRAAGEFFVDPGFVGSLNSPPLRRSCQSLKGAPQPAPTGESGTASQGAVLLFEYAGAVPSYMQRVLKRSLWGDGERGPERPDEVIVHGRLLWVISFPYGDATAEWVKSRLRTRFGVPAHRTRPALGALEDRLWELHGKNGAKEGLAALAAAGPAAADWSMGAYLRGEFLAGTDWPAAESAYRRALELHDSLADPLAPNLAWAARDGVGHALLAQRRYAEAADVLARSKADGRALRIERDLPHTSYSLASALVQLGKWDAALRDLTDAVDGDKRWRELALTDAALAEARKRPEFRVALGLDAPKSAPVPPRPAAPPKAAEAAAFDALLVKPAELPAGWTLVDASQCVSTSAHTFFVTPDPEKIVGGRPGAPRMPAGIPPTVQPTRKACQSIVRPDGSAGSVLLFEYPRPAGDEVVPFLSGYFWGEDERPTDRHPEEVLTHGNFLWIFSFPRGDESGEWVKDRLRRRFRVPAKRTRRDVAPAMQRIVAAWQSGDSDAALRLLDARAALLADVSFAWFLRAEMRAKKSDAAAAEAAYRRALDLHDALVDPLDPQIVWASLDGLGISLLQRRKPEDARAVLVRAKSHAAEHGVKDASVSTYNLACALALLRRFDEALTELRAAIAASPSWKASARDDADFAEARKRPDFQALLAE